jgi:hypothetical protein
VKELVGDDKKDEDLMPTNIGYADEEKEAYQKPSSLPIAKGGRPSFSLSMKEENDINDDLTFFNKRPTRV